MAITVDNLPGNIRVPFFYASITPAQAAYSQNARALFFGHILSSASAAETEPFLVSDNVEARLGAGSSLYRQVTAARNNAAFQEIWACPVPEPAGNAATATITVGALNGNTGTVFVYVEGVRVSVGVKASDTPDTVATALATAINATFNLPVTAAAAAAVVTLTARHKGVWGNDLSIALDVIGDEGSLSSEVLTITAFAGGTGTPDIAAALAAMGSDEFDFIGSPFSDKTTLDTVQDFMDGISGRWSPMQQLYGHYFTAKTGTVGQLSAFGTARNDPHASIMACNKFLTSPDIVVGALTGIAAAHLQAYPEGSRPLQTLVMKGVKGPKAKIDELRVEDRQALYFDGISGYHIRADGSVAIDRVITTYQRNAWGSPDASWLDVETLFQNMFGVRYIKAAVTGEWGRASLVDANPNGIPNMATAEAVRDTIIHAYKELENLGVVEHADLFAAHLVVERDPTNANMLVAYLPLDVVNQLRVFAAAVRSFLQLQSAA